MGTRTEKVGIALHNESEQLDADSSSLTQDERLYKEILDAILNHRLSPGVKLKEDDLADIFSVSRTVVRRALLRLSHDRIVDMQPNRGASIIRPDVNKAREILGVRKLIEAEVIREATRRASKASLEHLRRCVESERDHMQRLRLGTGLRLSGDFHIQLAEISANATLISYLRELVPQTSLIIALYQAPNHKLCSHQEHFDLIDIMSTGDVAAASEAMVSHLQHIEEKLNLDSEALPGDLYTAFANLREV